MRIKTLIAGAAIAASATMAAAGGMEAPMVEPTIVEPMEPAMTAGGSLGGNYGALIGGLVFLGLIAAAASSDSDSGDE